MRVGSARGPVALAACDRRQAGGGGEARRKDVRGISVVGLLAIPPPPPPPARPLTESAATRVERSGLALATSATVWQAAGDCTAQQWKGGCQSRETPLRQEGLRCSRPHPPPPLLPRNAHSLARVGRWTPGTRPARERETAGHSRKSRDWACVRLSPRDSLSGCTRPTQQAHGRRPMGLAPLGPH